MTEDDVDHECTPDLQSGLFLRISQANSDR
jgi:hypothetical protein